MITITKERAIEELKKNIKLDTEINILVHSVSKDKKTNKVSVILPICKQVCSGKIEIKLKRINCLLEKAEIVKLDENEHIIAKNKRMGIPSDLAHTIKSALFGEEKVKASQEVTAFY